MGERQARQLVVNMARDSQFGQDYFEQVNKVLAEVPDVGAVLRLLRALPEEIQSAFTTDDRILIGVLCNVIGRKFGFRLTEDGGWEYTDAQTGD